MSSKARPKATTDSPRQKNLRAEGESVSPHRGVRRDPGTICPDIPFDLLRMELEDEDYMRASGAPWGINIPADQQHLRLHVYVHMWMTFWESQFILGEMPELFARASAGELFSGEAGRQYWKAAGARNLTLARGRRLGFFRIVNEEYQNSIKEPAATWGVTRKSTKPRQGPLNGGTSQLPFRTSPAQQRGSRSNTCYVADEGYERVAKAPQPCGDLRRRSASGIRKSIAMRASRQIDRIPLFVLPQERHATRQG
jgi:hypothetical protein